MCLMEFSIRQIKSGKNPTLILGLEILTRMLTQNHGLCNNLALDIPNCSWLPPQLSYSDHGLKSGLILCLMARPQDYIHGEVAFIMALSRTSLYSSHNHITFYSSSCSRSNIQSNSIHITKMGASMHHCAACWIKICAS